MINKTELFGIARTLFAAVGGVLVGKGVIDAETATAVAGALATLVAAVWSVRAKRKDAASVGDAKVDPPAPAPEPQEVPAPAPAPEPQEASASAPSKPKTTKAKTTRVRGK